MPIQAFVDDSGGKGQGTHFVLAGLISPSEKWFTFANEWRECMAGSPRIRYFKMTEAKGINGEFHGFTVVQRDDKLAMLADVINRNVESSIFFGLVLKAHDAIIGDLPKPLNEVYFWPFLSIIMGVAFDLADDGHKEKFEIVFDEQYIFGLRARDWYPISRDFIARSEPATHAIMPADVMFRDDAEFLPLQAADLLAGCHRINLSNIDGADFRWLLEKLPSVRPSKFSAVDDEQSLQSLRNYPLNNKEPIDLEMYDKCQTQLAKFKKTKRS